jgi:hypothetical protein
MRENVESST